MGPKTTVALIIMRFGAAVILQEGKLANSFVISQGIDSPTSTCDPSPITLTAAANASRFGIMRSTDNGKTWKKVVNDSGSIGALSFDGSGQIYAGTVGYGATRRLVCSDLWTTV